MELNDSLFLTTKFREKRFLYNGGSVTTGSDKIVFKVFPIIDGRSVYWGMAGNLIKQQNLYKVTIDGKSSLTCHGFTSELEYLKIFVMQTGNHGKIYKSFFFKFHPKGKVITIRPWENGIRIDGHIPTQFLFKGIGFLLRKSQALDVLTGKDDIMYLKRERTMATDMLKKAVTVETLRNDIPVRVVRIQ